MEAHSAAATFVQDCMELFKPKVLSLPAAHCALAHAQCYQHVRCCSSKLENCGCSNRKGDLAWRGALSRHRRRNIRCAVQVLSSTS